VDLARLAGVSAQQIRNYADAGILPPVPRSAAGYRRFGDAHRRALLAYRALAKGSTPVRAREIMHAVHAGDVAKALGLLDACHAELHEQRRTLQATRRALEAVAGTPDPAPHAGLSIGDLAAQLQVRTSALRTWESAGLLAPGRERGTGYRRYGPADVRDAQMIRMLRQARYPLPRIGPILDDLRRAGSTDALHGAIAERNATLTAQARALLEAASHLHDLIAGASK
jgi:DNA-binding transcriptional MerR regulator